MSTQIHADLPDQLIQEARTFIEEGWAEDMNELLVLALRRYMETHSSGIAEKFVRDDVAWGLQGKE